MSTNVLPARPNAFMVDEPRPFRAGVEAGLRYRGGDGPEGAPAAWRRSGLAQG